MRAIAVLLAWLIVILPTFATAKEGQAPATGLPFALAQAGAATDGAKIYVFGGANGAKDGEPTLTDAILEMDPQTGVVRQLDETLPSPRGGASAVWDGHEFLIIGGWAGRDSPLSEIVAFTPGAAPKTLPTRLPLGLSQSAVLWTGAQVLVFGGYATCGASCPNATRLVLRYHPDTQVIEEARAKFPRGFAEQAAVWAGDRAYLLGGYATEGNASGPTDLIFRYEAATDALTQLPVKLPEPRSGGAVGNAGGNAFLLGGTTTSFEPANDVLRFDMQGERGSLTGVSIAVPRVRTFVASAQVGARVFLIGGAGCPGIVDFCQEVLVYDVGGGPPAFVARFTPPDVAADRAAPGFGWPILLVAALCAVSIRARR